MPYLHREYCRRQHRTLGQYLATEAWLRGIDCLVIERVDLLSFLGLKQFKSERISWLQKDLEPWFPYQVRSPSHSSLGDLFLSRVPIADFLPGDSMTTDDRIARMPSDAPLTQKFSKGRRFPSEEEIIAHLAKLSAGLVLPKRRRRAHRKAR